MTLAPAMSAADRYLAEFEAAAAGRRTEPRWLAEARREGMDRFARIGFPTTREEEWRFTSLAALAETPFERPPATASVDVHRIRALEICEARRHLVVFVDGRYAPDLSSVAGLPRGVVVGSLREALASHTDLIERHFGRATRDPRTVLAHLNTALADDGAFVYAPAGTAMEEPVQLLYLTTAPGVPTVTHVRNLVIADREARLALVETYGSANGGAYWTNAVTDVVVGDAGRVDLYRVQRESERAYHTGATYAEQTRDSALSVHPVVFGGALSRHDIVTRLAGENGRCVLNGLYLLVGDQHADHHTTIDHAMPHCESHEYMNGVLDGHSHGVFNGRIIVRPGAQRTDSKQTNNNLVLSNDARADSQPQLEIYADDVKCTHGATLGPIDPNAMFYLTSRGVTTAEARSLLTYGFGAEIINRMEITPLQAQLDRLVRRRVLGGAGA